MLKLLLLILSLNITLVQAQITFQETYGGEFYETGLSVKETQDGNYICVGQLDMNNNQDILLKKIDTYGDEIWSKTIGTTADERVSYLNLTSDGGFILCGSVQGFLQDTMFLMKTDSSGDIVWYEKYLGESPGAGLSSVQQTSDNGYIAVGRNELYDKYLLKTNEFGIIEWTQSYAGTGVHPGVEVLQLPDNGYAFVSTVVSPETQRDIQLTRTDDSGEILWSQQYNWGEYDYGSSLELTNDGGFILAGNVNSTGGGALLVKTNISGDLEWINEYVYGVFPEDISRGYSVKQATDGGYVVAGLSSVITGEVQAYCLKTDPFGTIEWESVYPNELGSILYDIDLTSDGGYVMFGFTNVIGVDGDHSDFYLIKIDGVGFVGLTEGTQDILIDVFPNPFSDIINISLEIDPNSIYTVEIVDLLGKSIIIQHIQSGSTTIPSLGRLASGAYILLIKEDGLIVGRRPLAAN